MSRPTHRPPTDQPPKPVNRRRLRRWLAGTAVAAFASVGLPGIAFADGVFELRPVESTETLRRSMGGYVTPTQDSPLAETPTISLMAAPEAAEPATVERVEEVVPAVGRAAAPVSTPEVLPLPQPVPLPKADAFVDLPESDGDESAKPRSAGKFVATPPLDRSNLPVVALDGEWSLPPLEVRPADAAVRMASYEKVPALLSLGDLELTVPSVPPAPDAGEEDEVVETTEIPLGGIDSGGLPRTTPDRLDVAGPRLVATIYAAQLAVECDPADQIAYSDVIPSDVLEELTSLTGDVSTAPAEPETVAVTKSESDAQLFPGDVVPWIRTAEPLLDLRPGRPVDDGISYLDELRDLVAAPAANAPATVVLLTTDEWQPVETMPVAADADDDRTPYEIPPAPECEVIGGASVAELFRPLSSVQVTGRSTSPPTRPADEADDEVEDLERPEDLACVYLGDAPPAYYNLPPQTHVTSPFRDTYRFVHRPLYFSDPNLERCGETQGCLTTARAASLFFAQTVLLPYQMGRLHPGTCVEALPDCPTCSRFGKEAYLRGDDHEKGLLVQAAATTGLIFLIP